jgi:hypothetical protein
MGATIAAYFVAFKLFPTLTMDTAMFATVIGTPFLVGAAALVLSKRSPDPGE